MKQILQSLTNGETSIMEAPAPTVRDGHVLIHTNVSLISSGTERMLVDFGKASYFDKARQQPEKVKMVFDKVKTDGLLPTLEAVRSKLAKPLPLGYCNVGVVADVGKGVLGFSMGERVVSNGPHADVVNASQHLCARIPDTVDDESAVFTVVASIALQGIRLLSPTLGESVVVMGVGLIGLLAVQLLKAQGCRVLAIDFDDKKLSLAAEFGAEICRLDRDADPVAAGWVFSRGQGVDAVLVTAATQSSAPVIQAAHMSRKRGRIVLVGVSGLALNRQVFYEKELCFQVSCSYGPGRYDPDYEQRGQDYPIGFVRWTAQRNFEACLELMAQKLLKLDALITHRYVFEEAVEAYKSLSTDKNALGIVLQYPSDAVTRQLTEINFKSETLSDPASPVLGVIGAGNYAARMLIPAFQKAGAYCHTIVSSNGMNAALQAKKSGFVRASSDVNVVLADEVINTLVIATQHDTHAALLSKGLASGKHVFVEKPLALTLEQLSHIETAYHLAVMTERPPLLMVGFNRRFAPQIQKMKQLLQPMTEAKSFIMTVNAGAVPNDHWIQDVLQGGGRIIGEACHFIDLMRYLAGSPIVSVQAYGIQERDHGPDKASLTLGFADGSFGTIHYLANGSPQFPKERIEVFVAGRILQLDNFRKLTGFGWPHFKKMHHWRQDKGQQACVQAFLQAISDGLSSPIPVAELFEVARISIQADAQLRQLKQLCS